MCGALGVWRGKRNNTWNNSNRWEAEAVSPAVREASCLLAFFEK